jgi:site-specific recombinase XerC
MMQQAQPKGAATRVDASTVRSPSRPIRRVGTLLSTSFDAGGTLEEVQDLLGHGSIASTQVYVHPGPARLRAAVDAVPSPRDLAGAKA